uniref:Lipase-like C-terminal domain-containing protein n=1 Tax=Ananas comosus var. bracteatus TaxID=296719 RepID=A0A6V7NTN4_ANACO|nr:unnamed protein product [Ananas comosus var. bracteatus]
MISLFSVGLLVSLGELFVSSAIHLLYGFYIFSSAVAADLSQALSEFAKPTSINAAASAVRELREKTARWVVVLRGAEKKDEHVLVPDLGSLTSIHDRARELFYYLKGGRVDYGEEHSRICGHSQFGRVYDRGHYLQWDEHHPIHFVGHSAGRRSHGLRGYDDTSEDWVLSVTSLSGALNGTTRTYLDGMQPTDGRSMKSICLLQLCRVGVIFYDWLDFKWLKNYYDFGFDHFEMGWRKQGISGLIDLLLGNSGPFASGDWILPDLTIQGSLN